MKAWSDVTTDGVRKAADYESYKVRVGMLLPRFAGTSSLTSRDVSI
jgi:hypothetical protein